MKSATVCDAEAVSAYVASAFPQIVEPWRNVRTFGVEIDGVLRAGVVLQPRGYHEAACTIFVQDRRAVTRAVVRAFLRWAFAIRPRLTFDIAKENRASRRFVEKLGARLEGRKRRAYDGVRDALVYGLLPDDCERWTR